MSPKWFEQEIVSGGTQSAEVPAKAERSTMIIGSLAWLALFVGLGVWRPWMLVFVFGLAVSIMLHELGHFWTARRSGMKATQFFLGFGSRVWSTHRNGVEYGLRAIPLGGFVKIIGMTNVDEVPAEDEAYTYRQGSYARRMWVITAGSVMHVLIAIAIIVPVYALAGRVEDTDTVRLARIVTDSPADKAGLELNDVVVSINGEAITDDDRMREILADSAPGSVLTLDIERDGLPLTVEATMVQNDSVTDRVQGFLGVAPTNQERVKTGVLDALVQGPKDLVVGVGQAVKGVAKVINPISVWGHLVGTNDDITSRPGTIVGATKMSDDAGKFDGWAGVLSLLAAVNLSVGVFNMFPLLPLDGGHAAIATYERLRSRRGRRYYADINKLMPVAAMCVALLAFMFLTGLYLDIAKN